MTEKAHTTQLNLRVATLAIVALVASTCIWAQENQVKPTPAGEAKRTVTRFGVDGKIEVQVAEPQSGTQELPGLAARAKQQAQKNVEEKKKLQSELDDLLRDGKLDRAVAVQREIQMRHLRWQLENVDNFITEYFEQRELLLEQNEALRNEVKELRKDFESLRDSLKK